MLAAMLSDAHLTGLGDPVQERVTTWLDGLEAEHCYVLGDLFHFWWGFEDAVLEEYRPVLSALQRLRDRGIGLTCVRGNHDFCLGPFFTEVLGATVADSVQVELGGLRYLLVHGDQPDRTLGYRLTRRVLRGRAFDRLMKGLGPGGARWLGHRLAGTSRRIGGGSGPLLEAQQAWAAEQLAGDVDVVVLGHSHVLGSWDLDGGRLINLGDFARDGAWLAVTEEAAELHYVS